MPQFSRGTTADITALRNQLVQDLIAISNSAENTGKSLSGLGNVINSISNFKVGNISEAATALSTFNREISKLKIADDQLKALQTSFSSLTKQVVEFNTKRQIGVQNRQASVAQANIPVTNFKSSAGDLIDKRVAEQKAASLKDTATRTQASLEVIKAIWTMNEQIAQKIREKEARTWMGVEIRGEGRFAHGPPSATNTTGTQGTSAASLANETPKGKEEWYKKTDRELNAQTFKEMGFGDVAIKNLTTQLEAYGMKVGSVSKPMTEMSTGITTMTMQAQSATGVMRTFTAHIDRNGVVLGDTQKRFRSFGSAIMRDVVEVLKWTIAITAIYTPIRKFSEMLEQAKKIQLDMVDAQVALGNSSRNMQTVWEASARIATETSSALEGVIEGYSLAVAASASARTEAERRITTETLLKDSMVLAKLSGLDQKQSLDMLVGALSQLGMGLGQGTALLDSWVAVGKKSNVSVNQMAQSFAIVGSAAEEAGLSYHELNALVGTLAQNTTLSANELGNSVRGIIAAMQTDKAQAEFAKYGIATKNVAGDFRDLMDILRQLKTMQQGGLLDEKAMGALMQAGGAGARRGAQLSAIVQNLPMVIDLVSVSENANGEAAQAMGLEMKTLDAATTRLNNAFTALGVSLGGEGGILGIMTSVTDGTTKLINAIRSLVSVMKWAAPVMATFMITQAALRTQQGAALLGKPISGTLQSLLTPVGFMGVSEAGKSLAGKEVTGIFAGLAKKLQSTGAGTKWTGQNLQDLNPTKDIPWSQYRGDVARGATYGELAGGVGSLLKTPFGLGKMNVASLLGPALIAATNLGKPKEEGWARGGMGAGVGLFLAAVTGSALWATVGSLIATGFYDKFLTFEGDIAASWGEFRLKNLPSGGPGQEEQLPLLEQFDTQATQSLNYFERFSVNLSSTVNSLLRGLGLGDKSSARVETFMYGKSAGGKSPLDQNSALLDLYLQAKEGKWTGLDAETMEVLEKLINEWIQEQAEKGFSVGTVETTGFEVDVQKQAKAVAQYAATASEQMMNDAIEQIALGASDAMTNYVSSKSATKKIISATAYILATQNRMKEPAYPGMKVPEIKPMTPKGAVDFVSTLTDEQIQTLTASMTEYNDQIKVYNALMTAVPDLSLATPEQLEEIVAVKNNIQGLANEIPLLMQSFSTANLGNAGEKLLKDIVTIPAGLTPEQQATVFTNAQKMWEEYLELSGLNDGQIAAHIARETEKIVKMGEELSNIKTKIPQEYITPALEDAGLGGTINLQEMQNVTSSQLLQAVSQVPMFIAGLNKMLSANKMPLYQPNMEDIVAFTKDKAVPIHTDMTIVQMLLKDLIDVEKDKGLQGMYNLPAGAEFYVPVTAYEMSKATVTEMAGGGGGISSILQSIFELLQQYLPGITETTAGETEAQILHREALIARNTGEGTYRKTPTPTPTIPTSKEFIPAYRISREYRTPTYDERGAAVQEALPKSEPFNLGKFIEQWWKTFLEQGLGISQGIPITKAPAGGQPLASAIPQTIPEVKLPASLINWFNQQSLSTTPIASTNATQIPDQKSMTTALNLSVDSRIVLTVDGRTLATIIKPYLYEDLLRYNSTTSSTNRSVIA